MTFAEEIKGFVLDKLQVYKGNEYYTSDLAFNLTENENCSGYIIGRNEARQWIASYMNECSEYWNYEKFAFGNHYHNPFSESEAFVACVLIRAVEALLYQCPYINEHDSVKLTDEVIEILTEQINAIEYIALN